MSNDKITREDIDALKQLGMSYLVMLEDGKAFACEQELKINDTQDSWKTVYFNPFTRTLLPEKLDNYCDNWKESMINLNNQITKQEKYND